MAYPVTPRATFTWGPTAKHVHASPQRSHFQVFGRGSRTYFNARWDTAFWNNGKRKRALVVASTSGANVRRAIG